MREVQQVGHGNKWVVQRLHRCDPFVSVECQHLLQQVYKLPSVSLLCQDVCALQVCHVHLQEVTAHVTCSQHKKVLPFNFY